MEEIHVNNPQKPEYDHYNYTLNTPPNHRPIIIIINGAVKQVKEMVKLHVHPEKPDHDINSTLNITPPNNIPIIYLENRQGLGPINGKETVNVQIGVSDGGDVTKDEDGKENDQELGSVDITTTTIEKMQTKETGKETLNVQIGCSDDVEFVNFSDDNPTDDKDDGSPSERTETTDDEDEDGDDDEDDGENYEELGSVDNTTTTIESLKMKSKIGKENVNMQTRCSYDDEFVNFSDTTQNVNPAIPPSQRTGTTGDIVVNIEVVVAKERDFKNEDVGGVQGVTREENVGTTTGRRRKSFISFVLEDCKESFASAAMLVIAFGVRKFALSDDIQKDDDEEWRDSVYTMCALLFYIASITICSYCHYLKHDMVDMVVRAQNIVERPSVYYELLMYVTLIIITLCVGHGHGHTHALHIFPIMPPAGSMFILALNVIAIRSLRAAAAASSEAMASAGEEEEVVAHNRSAAEQEAAVNMKLRKVALFQLNIYVVTRIMNLMAAISGSNSLPFTSGLLLWIDLTLIPTSAMAISIRRHTAEEWDRAISCQMWLSIGMRAGIQAIALAVMLFAYEIPIFSPFICLQVFSLIDKTVLRSVNRSMSCIFAGIVAVSIGIHFMMLKYFMKFLTSAAAEEPSDWRHFAISVAVGCLGLMVNFIPLSKCAVRMQPIDEELGAPDRADSLEPVLDSLVSAV